MTDALLLETEGGPRRRCIAGRKALAAADMIRFVVGPDDVLVPDLAGRLPGRGMWLSAERGAVQSAVRGNLFAKTARAKVAVPRDLPEQLERLLVARCIDLVGLGRRAGGLVAGFDQVADGLRAGNLALVLVASDAGEEGLRRMRALAGSVPVVQALTRAEIGGAIGRDEAVHVGLVPGGLAQRLLGELRRLKGFRNFELTPPDGVEPVEEEDEPRS